MSPLLWAAWLAVAPPVEAGLPGAPAGVSGRQVAAIPWALPEHPALEGAWLQPALSSRSLTVPDWARHEGPLAGVECALPSSGPQYFLDFLDEDAGAFRRGGTSVYLPAAKRWSVRLELNNAHGASVPAEIFLGVLTLGFSTLRLTPDALERWSFTPGELPFRVASKVGPIECRAVSRDDVERWAGPDLPLLKTCAQPACLLPLVARLGLQDDRVRGALERMRREELEALQARARNERPHVLGFELASAEVECASTRQGCALVSRWLNAGPTSADTSPLDEPSVQAWDEAGHELSVWGHPLVSTRRAAPGELVTVTRRLSQPPHGAVLAKLDFEATWELPVPSEAWIDDALVRVSAASGSPAQVHVEVHAFGDAAPRPYRLRFEGDRLEFLVAAPAPGWFTTWNDAGAPRTLQLLPARSSVVIVAAPGA